MEDISDKSKQVQLMFDTISPSYDFLNRLLSFGQDIKWREKTLSLMPEISTLDGVHYDIACGTADMIIGANKNRKDYKQFIGFDLSSGMLEVARNRCKAKNIPIQFVQATAEKLPCENESANCVTISFGFRNMDDRMRVLQECFRVLKSQGVLLILDFFESENTFFSKVFKFYFRHVLPSIGGLFSDKKAYTYLPLSVAAMPSPEKMKKMLIDSGFCTYVEHHSWLSGAVRLFVAKKR